MTKILGVDPGIANCGYGLVTPDPAKRNGWTSTPDQWGHIETINKYKDGSPVPDPLRLYAIYDLLDKQISRLYPDVIVIERVFLHKNKGSASSTMEVIGIVKLLAAMYEVPLIEYRPLEIKVAVAGRKQGTVKKAATDGGKIGKQEIKRAVIKYLDLEYDPTPDHTADSLAVAVLHAMRCS